MAELLLKRGADPNGEVHASGTPVGRAYGRFDWELVKLACPLSFWNHIPWIPTPHPEYDRSTYLTCFRLILRRCHADVTGRFGRAILHDAAASYDWILPHERVAFAATLLDAGARLAVRDLLRSTPLGWACRWGRVEIVELLLERGADPVEPDAEEWARPVAWAEKMGRSDVLAALREHGP
jgi:ankyrin repeat protein